VPWTGWQKKVEKLEGKMKKLSEKDEVGITNRRMRGQKE
jgi:hypothetical protein